MLQRRATVCQRAVAALLCVAFCLRPSSTFATSCNRRAAVSQCVGIAAASAGRVAYAAETERAGPKGNEYDAIANVDVYDLSGSPQKLGDLITSGNRTVLALLTHFGDFNAWEYAQQLDFALPEVQNAGASILLVGIGGVPQARNFAQLLDLPPALKLYADPTGSAAKALGCSRGFGADSSLNGYIKILPMLLGIDSPGTLEAVFRGYRGDTMADRGWVDAALAKGSAKNRYPSGLTSGAWDDLGDQGLRPMELATLRLQNMKDGIIANWGDLAPADDQLVVQQGGTVIFDAQKKPLYVYRDAGILTYTPMKEVLLVLSAAQSESKQSKLRAESLFKQSIGAGF
eukprot:TRINITY_DN53206_c0_g1_i1.p1 TRINITY_DN53206_c0_g1~~TRINITY_DN53206_c0_g1_i1.p1  ORF type:complete len:344 (-),score=76.78 TRINITY_DN53206_c0_g1_i1:79-1110(-)